MSLVGTRPILPDELEQYELHHRARIAIKPGILDPIQVISRLHQFVASIFKVWEEVSIFKILLIMRR